MDGYLVVRKLKLQVQITVDGYVGGPEGQLDWMTWNMDDQLTAFINHLTDTSDTILLGRQMTPGFVSHWEAAKPDSCEYACAQNMVGMQKVVFSMTVDRVEGKNIRVHKGDIVEGVNELKR